MARKGKTLKRVGVDAFFRRKYFSREFTTPGNFEAANMLQNKLDRRRVSNKRGRLVFEYYE